MVKTIQTEKAPAAIGAYSQAVEKEGTLFISGQIPLHPETKELVEGIENQTKQVLQNIQAILHASGLETSDVVKNTIYVTSLKNYDIINEIYSSYFNESQPARAMVGVNELPKGALIEIESIAMR
ncbi:Rid family detoxifying hydrolase [Pseudalkalibacillus hwajinpoensis]|uniref:Rid family detoxifying hydrolase n=1 Tax=Guptibacillus hwajinpoensis TaxID=208199 RepID=UPI001CD75A77|nr:Rid family detoxifying hydrolase [Pseudalkalibacillus hwajinpoensis]MCA0993473.1 Rid family detoxifying hydrolase [Pseudalkalibacillus hwajinpoensis]